MEFNKEAFFIAMANAEICQAELAKKSGLSRNQVNDLYTGRVKPRPKTIGKIAKALGVPVSMLIQASEKE